MIDETVDARQEWDSMIETVMDAIPAKLSHKEWTSLRENIHDVTWSYVSEIFTRSSIAFHRSRDGHSEVRLWMTVGADCVDFQKAFLISDAIATACSIEGLKLARDALEQRIKVMEEDDAD